MLSKEEILRALRAVNYPGYDRDITAFGMVKYVKCDGDKADVRIYTGTNKSHDAEILKAAQDVLNKAFPNCEISVMMLAEDPAKANAPRPDKDTFKGVKYKIAIASGKGGVGKSTVAINLARAFAKLLSKPNDPRVGLMDCDVHGPSATILLKDKTFPGVTPDEKIIPPVIDGMKVMSMGMLVADDQPLIWRGAMVMGALKQFVNEVQWGTPDVMIFDLPPGTGDAVLTVAQTIPLDGALIVTTPNLLASTTAVRGAKLFEKTDIKILGVLENMSYLELPDGTKQFIFGRGAAEEAAKNLGVDVLASVPVDVSLQAESHDDVSNRSKAIFEALAIKLMEIIDKK